MGHGVKGWKFGVYVRNSFERRFVSMLGTLIALWGSREDGRWAL